MKIKTLLIAFSLVPLTYLAAPPFAPNELRQAETPVGRLGYRIGKYVTVEGVRVTKGKVGVHTLAVEKVGDYSFPNPVSIWVENVDLPEGQRCVIKGYETGSWIGVPPEVLEATGKIGPQAAWQFSFRFIATSVEQPAGVSIK